MRFTFRIFGFLNFAGLWADSSVVSNLADLHTQSGAMGMQRTVALSHCRDVVPMLLLHVRFKPRPLTLIFFVADLSCYDHSCHFV